MTTIDPMGVETRRTFLLSVIRADGGGPITTSRARQIYAASPWAGVSRNTARRDLRDLARRAYLVPDDHRGARFYRLGNDPQPRHPAHGVRTSVLEAIKAECGEWTTGRVKRTWHQVTGTHVLRMTARRYLAALHRDGHVDRHGDGTPRRYYTVTTKGATR